MAGTQRRSNGSGSGSVLLQREQTPNRVHFDNSDWMRRRRKRSRKKNQGLLVTWIIPGLIVFVLVFCAIDVYYLLDIRKNDKQALSHLAQNFRRNQHEEVTTDDKEPIYNILRQAGIHKESLDAETRRALPTWSQVVSMYGNHPVIYGLERCEDFTSSVEPSVSFLSIAGTFNSGTNLLAALLIENCQITKRMHIFGDKQKGMRWQVPWGKHVPVQYREAHVTNTDADVPLQNTFPMVTIREPYEWMRSMCRHKYTVRWNHNITVCPNLYSEQQEKINPIQVRYDNVIERYDSLPALYNDFYIPYLYQVDFPRVLVRFEDLLFYAENVTKTLCACGGGDPRFPTFHHVSESAKLGTNAHGRDKTNLVQAMIRYGSGHERTKGLTPSDMEYAKKLFDPKLLDLFNYHHPTEQELSQYYHPRIDPS